MIHTVLKILRDELVLNMENPEMIVIGDIAKGDSDTTTISDKVVITLLNIQEEATLKNASRHEWVPAQLAYVKKNNPAYLNLLVMISANRTNYENSLVDISKVIEVFQTKDVLGDSSFKFNVQLSSLSFDQMSYAWGVLGGKAMPSALYKVSIIKIQKEGTTAVGAIKTVDVESNKINQ